MAAQLIASSFDHVNFSGSTYEIDLTINLKVNRLPGPCFLLVCMSLLHFNKAKKKQ